MSMQQAPPLQINGQHQQHPQHPQHQQQHPQPGPPTPGGHGSQGQRGSPYAHGGFSSRPTPLHRGAACLSCRRRKMKCDAAKPSCGPCSRQGKAEECEYEESKFLVTIQRLEAEITHLRARVRELEAAATANGQPIPPPSTTASSSATADGTGAGFDLPPPPVPVTAVGFDPMAGTNGYHPGTPHAHPHAHPSHGYFTPPPAPSSATVASPFERPTSAFENHHPATRSGAGTPLPRPPSALSRAQSVKHEPEDETGA
ncbi:hypothetical protein BKA62DRAFT_713952 [Auriculariales sp. MPI-PUGE-AT-0066]|nr:hypothetical protein BKA62DRAFT_713952 [Auriculariales sp. MPI-PUGE-AT-0066]